MTNRAPTTTPPQGELVTGIPSGEVDTSMELRLLVPEQPSLPVLVTLRYETRDPYAVAVRFHGGEDVEWVFARELLAAGLTGTDGLGDVRVRLVRSREGRQACERRDTVIISLTSPDGQATLEADAADLRAFIERTEQICPLGGEHRFVDVDAELAALLAG